MRLSLEANCQCDLNDGYCGVLQQVFGAPDPLLQEKLVRSRTRCDAKLVGKVHSAQSGDRSQIGQSNLCREMIFDILDNSPQTPFLQRADLPTFRLVWLGGIQRVRL
jgi:hypothetical protein